MIGALAIAGPPLQGGPDSPLGDLLGYVVLFVVVIWPIIRGVLDQVSGTLRVNWVQPRVLQTPQISLMSERLQTWCGTVNKTLVFLENETPEFSSS